VVWILLGAPGAGKGTQAERLAAHLGLPHVSTGELLRQEARAGTELGRKAKSLMDAGKLVPDEVLLPIVKEALRKSKGKGCILDGYPRNTAQAQALEKLLAELSLPLGGVINLEVAEGVLLERLALRAEREGRSDDTRSAVNKRLKVYEEQTAPLLAYYQKKSVLKRADGEGTIEGVQKRLQEITSGAEATG
jgi:adenylate kinase